MANLLISILLLLLIFAIVWWVLGMIPVPPQFRWVVNVVLAIIFLISFVELILGGWSFPIGRTLR